MPGCRNASLACSLAVAFALSCPAALVQAGPPEPGSSTANTPAQQSDSEKAWQCSIRVSSSRFLVGDLSDEYGIVWCTSLEVSRVTGKGSSTYLAAGYGRDLGDVYRDPTFVRKDVHLVLIPVQIGIRGCRPVASPVQVRFGQEAILELVREDRDTPRGGDVLDGEASGRGARPGFAMTLGLERPLPFRDLMAALDLSLDVLPFGSMAEGRWQLDPTALSLRFSVGRRL